MIFSLLPPRPPRSTLFPYRTLFRSGQGLYLPHDTVLAQPLTVVFAGTDVGGVLRIVDDALRPQGHRRSEEHTSELQSRENLVCRLLLEKKKKTENEAKVATNLNTII